MEVSRKAQYEDSGNTVRMHRQQIDKLKKDNERVKEELSLETRQAKQGNNMSASAQIARLQDQADMYSRKIETERRRVEELDQQIKRMQSTVMQTRKDMGGINASHDNNLSVQKQIRILENRLDKALVKFNEALAHNKKLRQTIDNLRRERVKVDGIYRKLEMELAEKKDRMAQIIDMSNSAYEARDKAQSEMVVLKEQADVQRSKFESEWSQLGQLIEKDRKMKDFIKSKEREATAAGADPALEEEQNLRKRVTKGAWGIARDKANIHLSMEKVQSYEEAFAKIQKATKITVSLRLLLFFMSGVCASETNNDPADSSQDIDELVQTFINAEDHNFALFNYVNDLSHETETLEEKVSVLRGEVTKYQGTGVEDDGQRKKVLAELEEKLVVSQDQTQAYEARAEKALEVINSLKGGVMSIFDKIGCASSKTELLTTSGVTESNIMQYLGLVEERTTDLLEEWRTINTENRIETGASELEDEVPQEAAFDPNQAIEQYTDSDDSQQEEGDEPTAQPEEENYTD
jgi:hypothetical protein